MYYGRIERSDHTPRIAREIRHKDSSSIAAELQQFQQYVTYATIARDLGVSASTLYIWDFVLTFHHEVAILWGTKWTTSRILFFINRYFALAVVVLSTWFDANRDPSLLMPCIRELWACWSSRCFEHRNHSPSTFVCSL
ncbi:hypothetical protein DFH29DRAFT_67732 [Suillus ampliporus]|nr:hypothetical protein DFH29DRAFT_67732 [Suillus ampliporus]